MQAAGGIQDNNISAIFTGEVDGVFTNGNRIFIFRLFINGNFGLLAQGGELVDGGGALKIRRNQQGVFTFGF